MGSGNYPLKASDGKETAIRKSSPSLRRIDGAIRLDVHQKAAKGSRVPLDTSSFLRRAISTSLRGVRCWYFCSAVRLCIAEIGALGHRIQRELQIREVEFLRGEETVRIWMGGCAVSGPHTPDYIHYMQQVKVKNPFLSTFDTLLLSQAWKAGLESGAQRDTLQNQVDIVP